MKAYSYRPRVNLPVEKVEIEFPRSSAEEMAGLQEAIEKTFTSPEQHMMSGFLSAEAVRKDTREKIRIFIPDICFETNND